MKKLLFTLCIVHKNPLVLLGMKKRGFGHGRWNGFGGKVADKESIENSAKRELKEEAGIICSDIKEQGVLTFKLDTMPELIEVHVFKVSDFQGEPVETEEMKPQWFKVNEIPYNQMWPGDKHWLPFLLNDKNFRGYFHFKDINTLLDYKIEEV